jgi:hypothetical protein
LTLWHLAWMFTSIGASFALTVALPFVWGYACDYSDAERFKSKRLYWFLWRRNYAKDGLPCIPDHWAHGEMVDVPGLGLVCRSCGWSKESEAR